MRIGWLGIVMIACGSGSLDPSDDGGGGTCGEVTQHALDLIVNVEDAGGAPISGAEVRLEERAWEPGTLGTTTSDASGVATLSDLDITGVEDCWGIALDYQLVVMAGDESSETSLNAALFSAVSSGQSSLERTVTLP